MKKFVIPVTEMDEEKPGKESNKEKEQQEPISTQKSILIRGKEFKYKTITGTLKINQNKSSEADIFFVAYKQLKGSERRPLTFAFNGGPGSSSAWLHMGALAPKKVFMGTEGFPSSPPYKIVENEHTWLQFTDLVLIDPVGTGYSYTKDKKDAKEYYSVETDVKSIAKFIRCYLKKYGGWNSPKYIAGESYGSLRAAALSEHLEIHEGIYLNGVILVSTILNLLTGEFDEGNDLPFMLYIPNYAAAAWYHKKLSPDWQSKPVQEVIQEAEKFALHEYALALLKGDTISATEKASLLDKLENFTGIKKQYWIKSNLRVSIYRFIRELLRDEFKIVGRLDSRFSGFEPDGAGDNFSYDPSYSAILGPFTQVLNYYMIEELEYQSELKYRILNSKVHPWNWNAHNKYLNVAPALRRAMMHNPNLRILVMNGYYDLATPHFATEYTFNHLHLSEELRKNISFTYYESGHMMYIHEKSLQQFTRDAENFIVGKSAQPSSPVS